MNSKPRLIMLPGLGADARLLEPQSTLPVQLEVPRWVDPLADESLASYARRMADEIDTSEPFFLGGSSFGGMLAIEMSGHMQPKAVLLVSSARSSAAVSLMLRGLSPLASMISPRFFELSKRIPGVAEQLFGAETADQIELFEAMLADTPSAFLLWAAQAIMRWPGAHPTVQTRHLHGTADRVIPGGGVCADVTIPGAGHLMNLTHAGEVNAVLSGWISELA